MGRIWDTCPRYSSECSSSPLVQAPHPSETHKCKWFSVTPLACWCLSECISSQHVQACRDVVGHIIHNFCGTYIIYMYAQRATGHIMPYMMYGTYTGHMSQILIWHAADQIPGISRSSWNLVRYLVKRRQFNAIP